MDFRKEGKNREDAHLDPVIGDSDDVWVGGLRPGRELLTNAPELPLAMFDEVNIKVDGAVEDCHQMADLNNIVNDGGEVGIELKWK